MPQRAEWVGSRRAPRRNDGRDDHDAEHDRQRAREGDDVGRGDAKSTLTSRRLTPRAAAMPTFAFGFLAFGALPVLRNEYAKYPDIYFIEWTIVGMVIGLIYKPTP